MTFDTRIALFLLNELVSALRANDPDTFKRWLCGYVQDPGKSEVEELLLGRVALASGCLPTVCSRACDG
ncbi:hypothetical protein [Synechococcus sp. MIT S1220]|uniref:hypothetical protein n=1 Tax=Synechococcus sp. MIT S1220 TaxID=3082549 RepID=UPI0039AF5221